MKVGEQMKVYQIIRKNINDKGLRQNFISDKTGITQSSLSLILNGQRKISAEEFIKIGTLLNLDFNLFKEEIKKEINA